MLWQMRRDSHTENKQFIGNSHLSVLHLSSIIPGHKKLLQRGSENKNLGMRME